MITTQSSTITIINNGWVIKNNASDWPHPKGGDSLYLAWDNLSAIWNRPAMLMQWPIPPKLCKGVPVKYTKEIYWTQHPCELRMRESMRYLIITRDWWMQTLYALLIWGTRSILIDVLLQAGEIFWACCTCHYSNLIPQSNCENA